MRLALKPMLFALLALSPLLGSVAMAVDPEEMADPVLQQRYRALTHELRCMQCQNQTIADSPVGLAGDLRREVRELLLAGKSDQDIRDYMTQRYGDFILFRPRFSLRTAWLWLAPIVLLLIGVFAAVRIIRQRERMVSMDESGPDEDVGGASGGGR